VKTQQISRFEVLVAELALGLDGEGTRPHTVPFGTFCLKGMSAEVGYC